VAGVSVSAADVGLIVAALDLNLVRLVRGAMAPNPCGKPVAFIGPAPNCFRFLPRRRIHPTPRFEPRPVIHPTPRLEPTPATCEPPHEPEMPVRSKSPIEPPWKVLPWEQPPAQPAPKVKLAIYRPDVVSKGSLIDFFI
jgi:hypothetical protein